jgi:hypothetical protein
VQFKKVLFSSVIFLAFFQQSPAQTCFYGGRGIYRTLSAEVVGGANVYVNGYFSSYFKKERESMMIKDHTLTMGVTLGLFRNFEATLGLVPYQDDQKSIWGPPGDTKLGLKYHLPFLNSAFQIGWYNFFIFPTSKYANINYEPFSSGKFGWGSQLLTTVSFENVFPMLPMKMHLNVGYLDHNLGDQFFVSEMDQMLLGFGIVFPIRSFQVFTEYTAEVFVNTAEVDFMENSMRVTQGFKFLGPKNFVYDLIFDIGLTNEDSLQVAGVATSPLLKDYADWKVTLGVSYRFSLKRLFDRSDEKAKERETEEQKKLDKIKEKRESATKDLESMKEVLDKKIEKKKEDK